MHGQYRIGRTVRRLGAGAVLLAGCAGPRVCLPPGHLPAAAPPPDVQTAGALVTAADGPTPAQTLSKEVKPDQPKGGRPPFELPRGLPGVPAQPFAPPRFQPNTPLAEREKAVAAAYPAVTPVAGTAEVADAQPLSLADLQRMAAETSPVLRRATAAAEAAFGPVVQAGLYPNPTVGYQGDQIQPRLNVPPGATFSGAGQQGGFVNQLIKTAGKLSLAQAVAGFDYLNAVVAVRRAEVDVTNAVRTQYFAVLVARQAVEVNRTLTELTDEVYRLQLRQVVAGEAAGYEPLLLYAQAEQARNALAQAEATARAAWRQLAAAVGRPDLPPAPLTGRADAPAPVFDLDRLRARILEQHTDLLTARNTVTQAEVNLRLQRRLVIPDLTTNQYHQYDNAAQTYQFGLQFGVSLPVFDRNQGNIRQAAAQIGRATADLTATQNDLQGRLAEAIGRYEASRVNAARYREKVIPSLSQAYRAIIRRYQAEPEKVGFNDIVVAQQNLATVLQAYLAALNAQWQAVVDVATLGQLDDLYPPEPAPESPAIPDATPK
ncbi:MAG: TolC family protein [Gemmataceae bacterium]